MTKATHGGLRPNAGRKSPYTEKTKGVKFTCPISKVAEFKIRVGKILKGYR